MDAYLFEAARYFVPGTNRQDVSRAGRQALQRVHSRLAREPDGAVVACLCGTNVDVVVTMTDRNGLPCRLVLCRHCGLVRMNPQPSADFQAWFYAECYRDLYGPVDAGSDELFANKAWKGELVTGAVRASGTMLAHGPVVDIGCGGGWSLLPFAQAGRPCIGYDFDERLLEVGRRRGLDLRHGGIEAAERDRVRASLLICSHVLEHVAEPAGHLRRLDPLLASDGALYVEVPHTRRIGARLGGDGLLYWQRAHLWDFQREHLLALLRRSGFEPTWSSEDDDSVFVLCKRALETRDAPMPALGARVEGQLLAFEKLRRRPRRLLGRALLDPLRRSVSRLRRGLFSDTDW